MTSFIITVNADHTDDDRDHICDHCGESVHTWQYTTTENSLTATCTSGCPIAPVSVTLTANSVTLPDSPFNAQLKFEGDFKEVFSCGEIEYKYEDPGTGWESVDPDTFTPKPGNYQAGVLITGLPGNGGVAARSMSNADGAGQGGSVYLYVNYTAVESGHQHNWVLSQPDTGTQVIQCINPGCPIGSVTVNLSAHSVTLPDSPFNAEITGAEQLLKAFPGAEIGELVYKFKGPGDSGYSIVAPTAANAKAGEYQVGVRIKGIPAGGSQSDGGYADLYVKYTAVDPAVTAQTGDNRPIELMMAGVVVFSALAAAAFILDSKRKYSR